MTYCQLDSSIYERSNSSERGLKVEIQVVYTIAVPTQVDGGAA